MVSILASSSLKTVATEEDLQLSIFVEADSWEGQFDALEIWRSRISAQGPYEHLTGDSWKSARLPLVSGDPPVIPTTGPSVTLSGKSLALRVNEARDINIVFTGTNPLTYGDAATQINAQAKQFVRAFVLGSSLILETVQPGSGAILRIVGGDAAPLLGLPTTEPTSVAFGQDARLPLFTGQTLYVYIDHNGSPEFFYKTRFFNTQLRTTSIFSLPFSGKSVSEIDNRNLVRAVVDLIDNHGIALANRAVLLAPKFNGSQVDGKLLVDGKLESLTNEQGHVEFMLVRGQPFTIAIAGTSLVRDFTSPTDPAVLSFNPFDPAYGKDDNFKVRHPEIDFAVRRTL